MTPQWWIVGRREFTVRVRTVWFIVVTVLGPIGMLALILVPAYLGKKTIEQGVTIECIDRTPQRVSELFAVDASPFTIRRVPPDTPIAELEQRIRARQIDGYLVLPEDLLAGGKAVYRGANASNVALMKVIENELLERAVFVARARLHGLSDAQILALSQPVDLDVRLTTGTGKPAEGTGAFVVGYATMFLLYMAILLYAVNIMRSVVEEKSNRVVEIVVSTIRPVPLMLGKIVGVGSVGLLQLFIWTFVAFLLFTYREIVLGWFGFSGAGVDLPSVGLDVVAVTLAYFLFGYFFYSALYAAIGAMVSSDQEAQQLQTPVVMLLVIPVVCTQFVANDPRGGVAELLTLIPFSSPVLMPMRFVLGGASAGDVAASLALLCGSLAVVVWLAGRIYRIGILRHGKRPTLRELAAWLRHG
ncbi:MAG: ABC transporter permease [Deltaproteobacteria bacterium]|nr:MAG: ABC transporter permease [Deltaproteobacteria bacterium]